MYYNNSYFQHNIPKFCNGSYFNTKNKFFNNIDLSTTMMAVYPDGVVGIISINQPSSSFSYNYTNTKNFNYNFESNLQDSFLHSTLKKSNSNHSIKSEPAYNFKSNEAFKFDKGWKQGDECFAPYINGHVSFNYN